MSNKWPLLIFLFYTSCIANTWAERTLRSMSLEEKIGQLFMVATASQPDSMRHSVYNVEPSYVRQLITDYHIGGIIFLGTGSVQAQLALTQEFQQLSKLPLLIGQDCEWGLAMRLRDTIKFPYAMTLGALIDETLLYQMGVAIGHQCRAIGVHINFAPVVDINNNPDNPVINVRSFGSDKYRVTQHALAYMRGMQDAGILTCAKHFPGHGDTDVDSHTALPYISHDLARLNDIELYPFIALIDHQVDAIMVAHLEIPALEPTPQLPATLSRAITTDLLRTQLGYSGLIITDGLGMRGVTNNQQPGMVELKALLAGADILLCPTDIPAAVTAIKNALCAGTLSEEELNAHVVRILRIKEKLNITVPITTDVHDDSASYALVRQLYRNALTVLPTDTPLPQITTYAYVQLGAEGPTLFKQTLEQHVCLNKDIHNNLIVVALFGITNNAHQRHGISAYIEQYITELSEKNRIILVLFGNAYSAQYFKHIPHIIIAYEDHPATQEAAAEIIAGRLMAHGQLPIDLISP